MVHGLAGQGHDSGRRRYVEEFRPKDPVQRILWMLLDRLAGIPDFRKVADIASQRGDSAPSGSPKTSSTSFPICLTTPGPLRLPST